MALTLERWIAAAVAGCLIAVVLVAGGDPGLGSNRRYAPGEREILSQRESRAGTALYWARERLHMKVLRDSLTAVLAKMPRRDSVRLVVSGQIAKQAQVTRSASARVHDALPSKVAMGVDLVIPADTFPRGWNSNSYVLQLLPASATDRCVAIGGLATRDIGARDWIGPCGFYATFGMPGAKIGAWLNAGAWIYGSRWGGKASRSVDEGSFWYYETVPFRSAAGFPIRRYLSAQGYSCLAGNRNACRVVLFNPQASGASEEWWNFSTYRNAIRLDGASVWTRPGSMRYAGLLGPEMTNLLMEMSTSIGAEKFGQFWKSSLPPADAFRAATGQEIEDWTQEWMRRTYGEFGRGPSTTVMSAVLSILLALVALGGASVTWRRRQVA